MSKTIIVCTVRGGQLIPLDNLYDEDLKALDGQTVALEVTGAKPSKLRSIIQNASQHKYFANMARIANQAGYDQRMIMERVGTGKEIPCTPFSMKSLWKDVLMFRRGKDSTTKSESGEYDEDHRIFDNMMSAATDGIVSCALPSRESMSHE